jgi:methylmalonyl-CoA/ethylmalonyl-CoA epimerase
VKFDHVGIAVADLEAAASFWERLGFCKREAGTVGPQPQGGYPGLNARWAFYGAGEGPPAVLLLAPLGRRGPIDGFIRKRGAGVQHVAFAVRNLNEASASLSKGGIRPLRDQPFVDEEGSRSHFFRAEVLGGVLIELIERDPARGENDDGRGLPVSPGG